MSWRSGLIGLGVCGMCCSRAGGCGPRDIVFDFRDDVVSWGVSSGDSSTGSGGSGGSEEHSTGSGEACAATCQPGPTGPWKSHDYMLLRLGPIDEPLPFSCPPGAPTDW